MASNDNKPPPPHFEFGKIENGENLILSTAEFESGDINVRSLAPQSGSKAQFTNVIANREKFKAGNINVNVEPNQLGDTTDGRASNTINPANYYEMGDKFDIEKRRGRCVILNYKYFEDDPDGLNTRHGTEYDVGSLSSTFKGQNFDVIPHHNLTKEATENILNDETAIDHSKYSCFILCILSHGERGKFFCTDNETIEYEQIFKQFSNESMANNANAKCGKSLVGKPKLFFIQACQGENIDPGVMLDSSQVLVQDNCLKVGDKRVVPKTDNKSLPSPADMLAFFCCCPAYFSLRNPMEGSWFIQDFCQAFNQFANKEDLLSVLTKVKKQVSQRKAEEFTGAGWDPIKQMPRHESTLTKKIQF